MEMGGGDSKSPGTKITAAEYCLLERASTLHPGHTRSAETTRVYVVCIPEWMEEAFTRLFPLMKSSRYWRAAERWRTIYCLFFCFSGPAPILSGQH